MKTYTLPMSSRRLCVAGYSGHVILFKFKKQESISETLVLEIPITYENTEEAESPECEFIPRSLPKQPDSTENEKKVCEKINAMNI
jgi:syntaxin-binding protein 5